MLNGFNPNMSTWATGIYSKKGATVSQKPAIETKTQKTPSIGESLQVFLKETIAGKQPWTIEHQQSGNDTFDVLSAKNNDDMKLQLKGIPSKSNQSGLPKIMGNWEIKLQQEAIGYQKTLDGKTCYLPEETLPNVDLSKDTIPRLFRSAYETVSNRFDPIAKTIYKMTKKLQLGEVQSTATFIKPNLQFGPPMAASLIQVGKQNPRLEIYKLGDSLRVTVHSDAGKVTKLTEKSLENPILREALEGLILEVNSQQIKQDGQDLGHFLSFF